MLIINADDWTRSVSAMIFRQDSARAARLVEDYELDRLADYFFDRPQCIEGRNLDRVAALAKSSNVEVTTHAIVSAEEEYLMSDEFQVIIDQLLADRLQRLDIGGYAPV